MNKNDLMVLLQQDPDALERLRKQIEEEQFVKAIHQYSIFQIKGGRHAGYWRTKKPVDVIRKNREDLIAYLYDYYNAEWTLAETFDKLMDRKVQEDGLSEASVIRNKYTFKHLFALEDRKMKSLTTDVIKRWIVQDYAKDGCRSVATLSRCLSLLRQCCDLAVSEGQMDRNPVTFSAKTYQSMCAPHHYKSGDEKQYSDADYAALLPSLSDDNPYDLMIMFARCTGLRAGEMPALLKEDVIGDYINVHRQQTLNGKTYQDVEYTKNEKRTAIRGRLVPILPGCREIIEKALALPGESKYLFHRGDEQCDKVLYCHRLWYKAKKAGLKITNNHAFRMALNGEMIEAGVPSQDRAFVLGHTVQTNLTSYSHTDIRRVAGVLEKMSPRVPLENSEQTQ